MQKILNKIIHIFSIDISSKYISNALQETKNIIVLHRHKIFLLKILWFQFLGIVLVSIYVWIIVLYASLPIVYIMSVCLVLLFLYWLYSSALLYKKHLLKRETCYIWREAKILIDKSHLENYITNAILVSIFLCIDIIVTLFSQISFGNPANRWVYLLEFIIFILILLCIYKTIKAQLDYEMDIIIFSPWSVKFIDREWLYTIESKIYLWNQIQTIEISQSGWLDAVFQIWTLRISTSMTWNTPVSKVISFGKICYSQVVENKLRAVIYTNSQK